MPTNFCFVIDRVLAGMGCPGFHTSLREDLEFLKAEGIGAVVSLTETPLESATVEAMRFRYLHLPVIDFTPPTLEQIQTFMLFQEAAQAAGVAVAVHCAAGRGRTGALLACALVRRGLPAEEAIERLRALRPHSIETLEQEEIVRVYERILRPKS